MMKGKKEAPSPSPPFCPRLLNQSRLTFPPLCLGERESRLWSTQRLKRQIVGQINPFRSSGKIYGIGKPKTDLSKQIYSK
uniref:Putative ovule protein n=1 Tax=Solanum chacoense TaxID=4108 RepID=A0A0V0GY40_SOLCH